MSEEMRENQPDPAPAPAPERPETPAKGKKPVVVYIMILFIAAFLLMALSFFMHQRSNTEALGELQNSVNAMQEIQISQERIIELQEELDALQEELEEVRDQAGEQQAEAQAQAETLAAMLALYDLQQAYSTGDYPRCQELIDAMEAAGTPEQLPEEAGDGLTPPRERYSQFKDAVREHLAA